MRIQTLDYIFADGVCREAEQDTLKPTLHFSPQVSRYQRVTEKLSLSSAVLKKLPFFAALFLTAEDRNCSVTASEKEAHS